VLQIAPVVMDRFGWKPLFRCAEKVAALVGSTNCCLLFSSGVRFLTFCHLGKQEMSAEEFELRRFGSMMTRLTDSKEFKHPGILIIEY